MPDVTISSNGQRVAIENDNLVATYTKVGPTGSAGATGATGATGPAGPAGPAGDTTYTLVETKTISGTPSELDFVTGFDGTYNKNFFVFENLEIDTNAFLKIRMSTDGGSTFEAGASDYSAYFCAASASVPAFNGGVDTYAGDSILTAPFAIQSSWVTTTQINGELMLHGAYGGASHSVLINGRLIAPVLGNSRMTYADVSARYFSSAAVDGIRFYLSAGAFVDGGIVKHYGVSL